MRKVLKVIRDICGINAAPVDGDGSRPFVDMSVREVHRKKAIYRVTIIGFLVNLLLSAGKLAAGIVGRSSAMIADAVHSLSDFATDLVVLGFVEVSSRPKDESHDYGHGKFETLATIIIGLTLFLVGSGIFIRSAGLIRDFLAGIVIVRPGLIAFGAAIISIVTKELLFRYTVVNGKRVNSTAVIANAWHHRSDAFSSIGTAVGIGGAFFLGERWRILDPIAALIVSGLIIRTAFSLVIPGINELVEKSLPEETESEILKVAIEDPEIREPHNLKTRRIGANIAIELHIRLGRDMTVQESHEIAEKLELRLKERFGIGTQVIVHVEPVRS